MAASGISLKLLIDTQNEKVIFAEAGKEFIDFLFNILSLPIATAVRLLQKKDMVGCLANLYESIENLDETYMHSNMNKSIVLKPQAAIHASAFPLPLKDKVSTAKKVYMCSNKNVHGIHAYAAYDPRAICPQCNYNLSSAVQFVSSPAVNEGQGSAQREGYVKGVVTYMVMDDLVVSPMSTISSITLLNKFNIKDVGVLQETSASVGMDEGLKLLKESLHSNCVLTEVFVKSMKKAKETEEEQTNMGLPEETN